MRHHKTEAGISLLGGALLGAAMMYVLDPETGRARRREIARRAQSTLDHGGGYLGHAWEQAKDLGGHWADQASNLANTVRNDAPEYANNLHAAVADSIAHLTKQAARTRDSITDEASDRYNDLSDRASNAGRHWFGQAKSAANHASDQAGGLSDYLQSLFGKAKSRAADSTHSWRHSLARSLDPEHVRGPGHAVGWSLAGVGTLVCGAATMYYFDPDKGAVRRSECLSGVTNLVKRTGDAAREAGESLVGLFRQSVGSPVADAAPKDSATGERLVQQVRSALSRVASEPTMVQLMADADGNVTLYGTLPEPEVAKVLEAIHAVPGVTQIFNRLDLKTPPLRQDPATLPTAAQV